MATLEQGRISIGQYTVSANGAGGADARVRVGVIGLGYWGPNLVRVLNEAATAEAAWMCDLRPELLEALGRRFPSIRQTQDLDEMLEDDSVDAVAVVTPVSTHHDLAMRALKAGKHVFVEKPLAPSSELAIDLIRAADERGLVLMPGHTFLYSPPVNRIRELIRAGELGEIYFISMSRVNLGLHQSDVSVIWDLGPHDFSILLYWLDEQPSQVISTGRACIDGGKEDVAFITCEIRLRDDRSHRIVWLAPSKLRRTTVVGSKKMVVYDDCSNEPVRVYDAGVVPRDPETFGEYLKYRTGDIVSPHIEAIEPMALQIDDFCRAIRSGTAPCSSAQLGLDVVRIIEAAERPHIHQDNPCFPERSASVPASLTYASERAGMRIAEPIAAGRGDHRIRVLVLTNMYPTATEPHFGCFVKDQVDDLRRLGVDVSVLAFDGRSHKHRYLTWHRGFARRCGTTVTTSCMPTTGFQARSRPSNSQRRS